jgi:hypothetical protein
MIELHLNQTPIYVATLFGAVPPSSAQLGTPLLDPPPERT